MPLDAMTDESDEDLIAAYNRGETAAARSLTLRLTPRVLGQAFKVSTWLWQVTANLCTDRLRKRGRQMPLDDAGDPIDAAPSAADQMQQNTRAAALHAALAALPERQAKAVRLRHIEGLGNPEIAVILDTSVEAVESLTARGARALKAALADRRAELGFTDEH